MLYEVITYQATKARHKNVRYFDEVMDAREYLAKNLRKGDLFVTMGAGDNWQLGKTFLEDRKKP